MIITLIIVAIIAFTVGCLTGWFAARFAFKVLLEDWIEHPYKQWNI